MARRDKRFGGFPERAFEAAPGNVAFVRSWAFGPAWAGCRRLRAKAPIVTLDILSDWSLRLVGRGRLFERLE